MPPQDEIAAYKIGDVLSDTYELRAVLGSGGMGQVFEAHDRSLNRSVAIKVPFDRPGEQRLVLEAQALAVLSHAGIIEVYALPEHEGVRYLVMERLLGLSLEEHIERRCEHGTGFAVAEALDILIKVAVVLREIHRAGLAHRDVKPSNIMISGSRVVVLDLGVAQPAFRSGKEHTIVGSPAYIAPEIIGSSTAPGRSHLSDTYSLGVLAFELTTGTLPYQKSLMTATLLSHIEDPVPDARERNPQVPAGVAKLISAMMSKSPDDRPADMEEVVWRLRELRRGIADGGGEDGSILVIEDDEDMQALLEVWLAEWAPGRRVIRAMSGEEALEKISASPPGLMLIDLQLPGMSGMEVTMYVRGTRLSHDCPIVALSGRARTDDIRIWKGLGISHFVAKGRSLQAELGVIVERWHATQPMGRSDDGD